MEHQIITTSDGSKTIYLPHLDETYHSSHGAIQEAVHVFIRHGVQAIEQHETRIFEMGFGTGLNALLAYVESEQSNRNIHYSGIEAFHKITIRSIVVKTISLALLYTFVKTSSDIYNYLWISIFSILGNQVYNFLDIYLHLEIKKPVLSFSEHIKPLLLIFGATIASSIYTLWDTIILYFLTSPEIVGYYTVSTKLTKLIIPVITAIGGALIPTISYYYNKQQNKEHWCKAVSIFMPQI